MKTLTLKLENRYGIRKLDEELDFSNAKAIAIYAPNGLMKTSLAPTFQDITAGTDSGSGGRWTFCSVWLS